MTKYREIIRLKSLGISQDGIAGSCQVSKKTVNRVLKRAEELHIAWPLQENETDVVLEAKLFPSSKQKQLTDRRMPDFDYIQQELLRNGVNKKLLWTEYLEECRLSGEKPLMYSQFCYHIQQDEQKRHASMHIGRKPGEQIEVDWAGDPAHIIDPDTGEIIPAWLFVGVMTYSQYPYVEAFINEKQKAWITAHVHMFEYFGGVTRILVPDNCSTAVVHNNDWYTQQINVVYHEMAEHYGIAVIPARVRAPKDKAVAEGSVGNISTWITAALRNEQFFTLSELNQAIRRKLSEFSRRPFQKKEGSRHETFRDEEHAGLAFCKLDAAIVEIHVRLVIKADDGRTESLRDDLADRVDALFKRADNESAFPEIVRIVSEKFHCELCDDGESAFRADEHVAEIRTGGAARDVADADDFAVRKDRFQAADEVFDAAVIGRELSDASGGG